MAKISINKLKLSLVIGTKYRERNEKQDIFFDIIFDYNSDKVQKTDELNDAVDYHALADKIIKASESTHFFLIEKLADFVIDLIMEDSRIKSAKVIIYKPNAIPNAESISCQLSRER